VAARRDNQIQAARRVVGHNREGWAAGTHPVAAADMNSS
jgi:hypothetical protein